MSELLNVRRVLIALAVALGLGLGLGGCAGCWVERHRPHWFF